MVRREDDEMPMERNACLLDEVWQALTRVGLQIEATALAQTGRITAVSAHDNQLRILLQMTAGACQDGGRALADVENALRDIPVLNGIDVEVKPYPRVGSVVSNGAPAEPVQFLFGHSACVNGTVTDQSGHGWVVNGVEVHRRASAVEPKQGGDHPVRVLIRAWITQTASTVPGMPSDAA